MWFKGLFRFSFTAPDNIETQERIFPTIQKMAKDYAATIAATIVATNTEIDIAELTGAATLNLTLHSQLELGNILVVKAKSDTTARDITLGTGFLGTKIAGVISKTKVATFWFDGSAFVHLSTNQLD